MKGECAMDQSMILIELFTKIEWLLHRQHMQTHFNFGPFGDPRKGQGRVLAALKLKPEISQRELAYVLDMKPQSLGELLAKLEKNGYITRETSQEDKRVQMVRLTEAGMSATEQPSPFSDVFNCLSSDEQEQLAVYLERVIASLEANLEESAEDSGFKDPRLGHPMRAMFQPHMRGGFKGPRF